MRFFTMFIFSNILLLQLSASCNVVVCNVMMNAEYILYPAKQWTFNFHRASQHVRNALDMWLSLGEDEFGNRVNFRPNYTFGLFRWNIVLVVCCSDSMDNLHRKSRNFIGFPNCVIGVGNFKYISTVIWCMDTWVLVIYICICICYFNNILAQYNNIK